MVRITQKANVRAHVVVTARAEFTVIAVKSGLKRPAVAHSESSNTSAGLHDPSCGLVPEHHGVDIGSTANGTLGVGMQIGPADAYGLDPDLHFTGCRIFNRHISKPEFQGRDKLCGSHRMPFLTNDTCSVGEKKRREGPSANCLSKRLLDNPTLAPL